MNGAAQAKPPVAARKPKLAISASFAWVVAPLVATVGAALLLPKKVPEEGAEEGARWFPKALNLLLDLSL